MPKITQGSRVAAQPWALRCNPFGVPKNGTGLLCADFLLCQGPLDRLPDSPE
jgi:hypothetical protein